MKPPLTARVADDIQTPAYALEPLLPWLKQEWVIWECAEGKGNLSSALRQLGYIVVGSDILTGHNFLTWQPEQWDCIVTNPPYSMKEKFLRRVYELGKPFALLLPLTTLETRVRQEMFRKYGVEIILFDRRIDFELPSGNKSKSWFATAWFTSGLRIGRHLTFGRLTRGQMIMEF